MIKNMIIGYHWPYVKDFVQNLEKELRNFIRNWPIDVWMLIQIRDQRLVNYVIYLIFGIILLLEKIKMIKNMDIMEEKSEKQLKKLIKRYQRYQPHIKRILMLYILVEPLHLVIYQNPLTLLL